MPMLASMSSEMSLTVNDSASASPSRSAAATACVAGGRAEQHRELVATEPGHGVAGAKGAGESFGDLPQQEISVVMAQRVVDVLEPVHVDEQHGDLLARPLGGSQCLDGAVLEQRSIRQPGQAVVQGLVAVDLTLHAKPALVSQERDRDRHDQRDADDQRPDREGQRETLGGLQCVELIERAGAMLRGGGDGLGLQCIEYRVDARAVDGVHELAALVPVHRGEHLERGPYVAGVLTTDPVHQSSVARSSRAVDLRQRLSHFLAGREMRGGRNRAGLEAVLPLQ